jgi:hypothetical protein
MAAAEYTARSNLVAVITNGTLIWRKDRQASTLIEAFLQTAQELLQAPA